MFALPVWLDAVARGLILTPIALLWILILVRMIGLRSFSKMTAFDFVATIAAGSLLSTIAMTSEWSQFWQGLVALTALFGVQYLLAKGRQHSRSFEKAIGNEPILLMENGKFVEAALTHTRVAREDVYAKIRAANALELSAVRAVVIETTGDISVLHGDHLDEEILTGVTKVIE
ncbi:MAG: DUF421 domain-containing protein [Pseudomonadota bacterium]|nr:DUF421 domain-containing protein [Pseudomonadota bacterium]